MRAPCRAPAAPPSPFLPRATARGGALACASHLTTLVTYKIISGRSIYFLWAFYRTDPARTRRGRPIF